MSLDLYQLAPSELASAALQLNQTRLDFRQMLEAADSTEKIRDAVAHTDREIRNLAQALERLAVRLARPIRKSARIRKTVGTGGAV